MKNLKKILLTGTLTATAILAMSITSNAATVKVTGDVLNIRRSPSTGSDVIAMISKGVECEFLEDAGDWYKVKFQKYTGYVSKEYSKLLDDDIKVKEPEEKTEVEEPKKSTEEVKDNKTNETENQIDDEASQIIYKKVNQNADIKILPLIHSSVIGNVKKGTKVLFITQASGWSYIQTDTISGWVRNDILGEAITETSNNNIKNDNTDKSNNENTYKEKTGYINEESVNLRKGAGTSYSIIKTLTLNTEVTITGEKDGWYQIKSGSTNGYVSKEFVSDSKKVTTRGNTASRIDNSEKTKKAETKNSETTAETKAVSKETVTTKTEKVVNSKNSIKGTDVVAYAKKFLGYKYVYGGDGSNGTFDCSGFTMYVYKHFGINLPHGANMQYNCGKGKRISKLSDLQAGDIVFLTDYETGVGIGHCGIYIGNGNFIHASTTTYSVIISSFNTIYKGRFYAGLRLV